MGKYRSAAARSLVVVAVFALSGCALMKPRTVYMAVPVRVYCVAGYRGLPVLPIASLKKESHSDETVRMYSETVAILKGEVLRRDALLDACVAPSKRTAKIGAAKLE